MLLLMLLLMNSPATPTEQLWETIRGEPNVVLFMRHAAVEPDDALRRDDGSGCGGAPRLSEAGRGDARYIGGRMTTDPMLRELLFADAVEAVDFDHAASALIAAHRGNTPLVIVSHAANITRLTHETVSTTEAIVGRAHADGGFEGLGKVNLTD